MKRTVNGIREIDAANVIDAHGLGAMQVGVLLLGGLVASLDGFDNQIMAYTASSVIKDLGLHPAEMARVFSAGLFGAVLGGVVFGEIGDRFGRRVATVGAAALFGLMTFAVAFAPSVTVVTVARFFIGVGVGGLLPAVSALSSEFVPRNMRNMAVILMNVGIGAGGMVAGLLAAFVIAELGWRWIFGFGGLMTLVIALALIVYLPESFRFDLTRPGGEARAMRTLRRVVPTHVFGPSDRLVSDEAQVRAGSLREIFSPKLRVLSTILWCCTIAELFVVNVLYYWMPLLIEHAGYTKQAAILATTLMAFGSLVGLFISGPLSMRVPLRGILVVNYCLSIPAVLIVSQAAAGFAYLGIGTFLLGLVILGGHGAVVALVAECYPTALRSSGVGWAMSVGRATAILSPLVVGAALSRGWTTSQILAMVTVPCLLTALGVWGTGRVTGARAIEARLSQLN